MAAAEQKKSYQVIKQFEGVNTKANRTAIKETEFSYLENVMPIGFGNLKVTPSYNDLGVTFLSNVVNLFSCNLGGVDYLIAFEADGGAEFVDVTDPENVTIDVIADPGTFTADGTMRVSQWRDKYLMILDPVKGYFLWDGTDVYSVGSVGRIAVTNHGNNYTEAPIVTLGAPDQSPGRQATAIATISNTAGQVISIKVTSGGAGAYTVIPNVTISPPPAPGIQAKAVATLSAGNVVAVSITNPGSGYQSNPSVSFDSGSAAATATIDTGTVTSVFLTDSGFGYTSPPNVTISGGGGTNAAAITEIITFEKGTVAVNVTSGGYGYTNAANTVVTISGGGGTNASGTAIIEGGQVTQVLMGDPGAGYTNAANITVTINGGGATIAAKAEAIINLADNVGIASFSGRAWIAAGRAVYYSAAASPTDFTSVSAGNIELYDSTLHGNITQLLSANNFLYIFGDDSINVFSDVRVSTTGVTLFTNTNISASIGCKRPYAIFPYFRSVMFLNDYGVYALVGSTTTKVSDALDGIFPYIDFSKPIYGGQVLINNILCAAFNFSVKNAPDPYAFGGDAKQAVFFEKKWFFTSLSNENGFRNNNYITSLPIQGKIALFGAFSNTPFLLYSNTTSPSQTMIQTALLPMGDPIRTKQALKFGVEATNVTNSINVTVDSEYGSSPAVVLGSPTATWKNNFNNTVEWQNDSSAIVAFIGGSPYALYKSDAKQWGKYLGLTITSAQAGATFNTMEFEHELRVRF